ncbi:hypothetical protein GCM10028895_24850 [Pontibacter rugosus]
MHVGVYVALPGQLIILIRSNRPKSMPVIKYTGEAMYGNTKSAVIWCKYKAPAVQFELQALY